MRKRKIQRRRKGNSTKRRGATTVAKSGAMITVMCAVIAAGPSYLGLRQPLSTPVSKERPPVVLAAKDTVPPAPPRNLRLVK